MKKLIITIIFILLVTSQSPAKDWQGQCGDIAHLAGTIMETRLTGATMQQMMECLSDEDQINFGAMVVDAYEQPLWNSPKYKKRAILKFKNKWYLYCVKQLR